MEFLKNSVTYKLIISFINFLQNMITNSYIYNVLTKEIDREDNIKQSIIYKVFNKIVELMRKIITFLRLDKLLKDSIFIKPYIWGCLTIALAPILPTTLLMCLIIASVGSFILKVCVDKEFEFTYTPVNILVVLFFIIYMFCAVFSVSPIDSLKTAIVVGSGILMYFVIVNNFDTKKKLNLVLTIFCIIGVLVSLYGIYQYTSFSFFGTATVDKELFGDIKTRVTSTFDNPNVLGEYLLLLIPLSVSLFFVNKNIYKKVIIAIATIIMAVCLLLTYSRGCYLGLIFAAAIFVILLNFKFIIFFILGLIAMPFVLPKSIINRFTSIGNMKDSSTKYRVSIWMASIDLIKDYWNKPIGQGSIAFNKIYPLYAYNQVGAQHSHCLFLQVIIETGLLGFITFFVMLYRLYQYLFSGLRKLANCTDRIYLIGFVSSISGFLLQSVFDNTFHNLRVAIIFWMIIGLATAFRKVLGKEDNNEN